MNIFQYKRYIPYITFINVKTNFQLNTVINKQTKFKLCLRLCFGSWSTSTVHISPPNPRRRVLVYSKARGVERNGTLASEVDSNVEQTGPFSRSHCSDIRKKPKGQTLFIHIHKFFYKNLATSYEFISEKCIALALFLLRLSRHLLNSTHSNARMQFLK